MDHYNPRQQSDFEHLRVQGKSLSAGTFAGLQIAGLTLSGIIISYSLHGGINVVHMLLSLPSSTPSATTPTPATAPMDLTPVSATAWSR